jgi:branched-chain amino acid transport system permease protein
MAAFIIIGIIQGAVIGLLAIGIVLVYKGSRVFNFAQAEFGSVAAYFLYALTVGIHLPYALGLILALLLVGGVGWLVERLVVRPLFDAPRVTLLVATAGVALLVSGLELKLGGYRALSVARIIPGNFITLFGATITWQAVVTIAVLGGLAIGLAYFFNKTDLGLAVLATSQEPVATELVGIGTKRMSSFIWVFAAVLGGVAGVLVAPVTGFSPGFMTLNYLLLSFTAAVVGGVTSLAGAFVGGQIIGIVQSLMQYFNTNYIHDKVPGVSNLAIFAMLVAILLIKPSGLLGKEA